MNSMQIISVVVFLVVMIALITEKVHRTAAAVSGAVLLLGVVMYVMASTRKKEEV